MSANLMKAFEADVTALQLQEETQLAARNALFELSFSSDELTVNMRLY